MAAKTEKKDGIWETVKTVVYALLIAGVFRTLFFQPFWIPSGSMKDTLLIGDFLFVNKMAYGYSATSCKIPFTTLSACPFISDRWLGSEPQRGDVVVFEHPVAKVEFIKRLVGLPGDKIQMKNGVLFVNGQEAAQTPDGVFTEDYALQGPMRQTPRCSNGAVGLGGVCEKQKFVEQLPGGPSHSILNIGNASTDNSLVHTVPDGHYFFMGDNRDNSTDSRVSQNANGVGYVPFDALIGRADRVMFSSAGRSMLFFWTWRGDRFFKKI
ncbi:Signal peptidase I [Candidatus Rhodobacter oscarellae]|uniref:Signal peptidase I n=1 Tax=Candidatus Rhodobacter oscarellae TaxID=1675527 RepID=A0A0J9ECZ3_9RHOB|nr:signal peptidase I [Candidatus Rhodobacter lobularis]KMW60551.1 Signal peptidase I [Candidatus Rhodobacter lobularis]